MRQQYEAERRQANRTFAHDHSFAEWREEQRRIERGYSQRGYSPYFTWDWRPYLMDYNPWQRKAEVK